MRHIGWHTTRAIRESPLPGTAIPGTAIPGTAIPGTGIPGTGIPGTAIPADKDHGYFSALYNHPPFCLCVRFCNSIAARAWLMRWVARSA